MKHIYSFAWSALILFIMMSESQIVQANKPVIDNDQELKSTTSFLPFSDPQNEGGWILNETVSDEFNADAIDQNKWLIQGINGEYRSNWLGRAPSQFSPSNARQSSGMLRITTKYDPDFNYSSKPDKLGNEYKDFTTAAVIGKNDFTYGYMEIRAKVADASVTSGFWALGSGCELDVFESTGKPSLPNKEHLESEFWSSIHDWTLPASDFSNNVTWTDKVQVPFRKADAFHVYACEWDKEYLKFYADGELINEVTKEEVIAYSQREGKGEGWVLYQPVYLWLDSEIFTWRGLPEKDNLPKDFEVDYIRIWKRTMRNGESTIVKVSDVKATSKEVEVGTLSQLSYEVLPANADNQNITFVSSNPTVASIDATGKLLAKTIGQTTITVTTEDGNHTAIATITVTASTSQGNNILNDPGFESGTLDNWAQSAASVYIVQSEVYEGSYAAAIENGKGSVKQEIVLKANTTYEVSCFAKTSDASNRFSLGVRNETQGVKVKNITSESTDFEKISFQFTTGTAPETYSVWVYSGTVGSYYVDNFELKEIGSSAVPVTGIAFQTQTYSLGVSQQATLSPVFTPSNATNTEVVYSVDKPEILTVSTQGVVTGIASGTAVVTATSADGNFTATCTITVDESIEVLENLLLDPDFESGTLNDWPGTNTNVVITSDAQSGSNAAKIEGKGSVNQFVQLPANADFRISAYVKKQHADDLVYLGVKNEDAGTLVKNFAFTSTDFEKGEFEFTTGASSARYSVWVYAQTESVYTVDNFVLVQTSEPVPVSVSGVSLNQTTGQLKVGENMQLNPTITPADADNKTYAFSTSDASIAKVNEQGSVNAVGVGTATITVTTIDGNFTAFCSVTVESATGVEEMKREGITIFPIPANDYLTVQMEKEENAVQIEILDVSGRIVFSESCYSQEFTINTAQLQGLYILRIRKANGIVMQKFIVR